MNYILACKIAKKFISIYIKKINGLKNIPEYKAFIVAANHSSYLDDVIMPSIIGTYISKKQHNYVNSRFFKNYFLKKFLYWSGSIPVDVKKTKQSKKINENAFKSALGFLKDNEPVGIFPEGQRSVDGKLQKAKTGVAKLALTAKVPVLPIGIINSHKILPKGKLIPKFKRCVIVNIGTLMYFKKYYGKENNKKILRLITDNIMKEIARLSNQEYRY